MGGGTVCGRFVMEGLPLPVSASPIRQPAGLQPWPADPTGAPALPGGCRLLPEHQRPLHVPARPQAGPHTLLRLRPIPLAF